MPLASLLASLCFFPLDSPSYPLPSFQLCVKAGTLTDLPSCSSWFVPRGADSCDSIRSSHGLTPLDLYALNPGLQCDNLYPALSIQGGVAPPRIGAPVSAADLARAF